MARPFLSKLSPWIEQLIRNYGSDERKSSSGRLKAYVIGVGQMSQSQAQSCEGPTGFLFLSDGVLQIPAALTASAWENLQDQEDRESITSLVNTTVFIQEYQLQFHMAPKQTECRFFISVGELATTAAGPVKDSTPCCTRLPSVRLKIVKTWRALLGVEDSQKKHCGRSDLSELLGEWQHDCMHAVLQDIREKVTVAISCSGNLQPSTSTLTLMLNHPEAFTVTSWDVDRVGSKGAKCFSVPLRCLFIPEEHASQMLPSSNVGRKKPSEATQHCICVCMQTVTELGCNTMLNSPPHLQDCSLHEDMVAEMADSHFRPLANPWDIFSPPGDISSSPDSSPEATQSDSLLKLDHAITSSSRQSSILSPKKSQQASELSCFLPYQNALNPASLCTTTLLPSTSKHSTYAAQPKKKENQMLEETHRKVNKERIKSRPETLLASVEGEAQVNGIPPSWLFETQARGEARGEDSGQKQDKNVGSFSKKISTVHSNGSSFSYFYQVSGQDLKDLGRYKVDKSLMHWALRILVAPKQTYYSHNMSGKSNQEQGL